MAQRPAAPAPMAKSADRLESEQQETREAIYSASEGAPDVQAEQKVVFDSLHKRFQTTDGLSYLQYEIKSLPSQQVMDLQHTFVPPMKRGHGIAAQLCDAAFRHAKENGYGVIPTCSYVSETFLEKHPEWQELVVKSNVSAA